MIKEYNYTNYRDLLRELYILSKIESRRQANLIDKPQQELIRDVKDNYHDGFPNMLGFYIDKGRGEMLMADAGLNLSVWFSMLTEQKQRHEFARVLL